MANIGTFSKTETGFSGVIKTLAVNTKANLVSVPVESENSPQYRIYAGNAEIGAGWIKKSKQDQAYISVKLDDPSLPAPIHASLHEATTVSTT
jgi:uncharacterized protein (DUF736 family)